MLNYFGGRNNDKQNNCSLWLFLLKVFQLQQTTTNRKSLTDQRNSRYISVCTGMKKSMSVHSHSASISARNLSYKEDHQWDLPKGDSSAHSPILMFERGAWIPKKRPLVKICGKELPGQACSAAFSVGTNTSFQPFTAFWRVIFKHSERWNEQHEKQGGTIHHVLLGSALLFAE